MRGPACAHQPPTPACLPACLQVADLGHSLPLIREPERYCGCAKNRGTMRYVAPEVVTPDVDVHVRACVCAGCVGCV